MRSRTASLILSVALACYALVGWQSLSRDDFGGNHDEGIYVVTARSLAETGEYRIISLPGKPAQRKYPILFPALLALVWNACPEFPANVLLLKAVSLVAGGLFLVATYGFLRRRSATESGQAPLIVLCCALLPGVGDLANSVLSELPFAAISLTALWLLDWSAERPSRIVWGLLVGSLAGAAWLTRSLGIALPVALVVGLAWRRNWKLLFLSAVGLALVQGLEFWTRTPVGEVDPVYDYYVNYRDWFRQAMTGIGPGAILQVPFRNLGLGIVGLASTLLPGRLENLPAGWPLNLILIMALLVSALGLLLAARGLVAQCRGGTPEPWALYLGLYLALVLVWPFPPPPRFFVPVLPLLLLAAREGWLAGGWNLSASAIRLVLGVVGVGVVASSAVAAWQRVSDARLPTATARYRWLEEHTDRRDVIACFVDPNCFLYTGRVSVSIAIADVAPIYGPGGAYEIRPASVLEMIDRSQAAYLMLERLPRPGPFERLARETVENIQANSPKLLTELWSDPVEDAQIYRVNREWIPSPQASDQP